MDKVLLTLEEAAETLSICRTKVYELVGAGLLRSVRIGTSRRIPREALDEFGDHLNDTDDDGRLYSLGRGGNPPALVS